MEQEPDTAAPPVRRPRRRIRRANQSLLALIILVALFSYLTNPFTRFSVVRDPFLVTIDSQDRFVLTPRNTLEVYEDTVSAQIATVKSGWHIFVTRVAGGNRLYGTTAPEIIAQIHKLRFNPQEPYLISGDHFSVLYPRSLGIFYHTLLDPRTALNAQDWKNRQEIYLKTVAYALSTFAQSNRMSTTIVPVGPREVTLLDIYSPPSDTLYSVLYGLAVLNGTERLDRLYPFAVPHEQPSLRTQTAADTLLADYKAALTRHYAAYLETVRDPETGLVRDGVILSGTKDSVKRTRAFYDNVMLWRTMELAQRLGITAADSAGLAGMKRQILSEFWDETGGYFREELGSSTTAENYSSDWLIAVMTGFLDLDNPTERGYAIRSIEYIRRHNLDQPFGLKYQPQDQKDTLHTPVRLFAPTYASSAIWSHWGMEYTKLLARLYQATCTSAYLTEAERQIARYTENIERYRGFPELYDQHGEMFIQTVYKSVRGTGWVVNYEEAAAMVQAAASSCTR